MSELSIRVSYHRSRFVSFGFFWFRFVSFLLFDFCFVSFWLFRFVSFRAIGFVSCDVFALLHLILSVRYHLSRALNSSRDKNTGTSSGSRQGGEGRRARCECDAGSELLVGGSARLVRG